MAKVSIDEDFARFGSKSYAINKINSLEVRDRHPYGIAGAVICGLGAVLCLFGALGASNANAGGVPAWIIVALILGGLMVWQWQRSKTIEYMLFLMTSSSETQAFVTRDEDEVLDLRDQIESAMLRHSRGAIR